MDDLLPVNCLDVGLVVRLRWRFGDPPAGSDFDRLEFMEIETSEVDARSHSHFPTDWSWTGKITRACVPGAGPGASSA